MNRLIIYLSVVLGLYLTGCKEEIHPSPDQTYRAYHSKVVEGRSFEEELRFHAEHRQREVLDDLKKKAASSDQTVEEIQSSYLNFTQSLARCGQLTLIKEAIEGKQAKLSYSVKDTCNTDVRSELKIEMVFEDGWKILSDTVEMVAK